MPFAPRSHAARLGRKAADARYARRRAEDPALAMAQRLRESPAWRSFRAWLLKERPLCQDPFGSHKARGLLVPAVEVHHKRPIREAPELLCDPENVLALCVMCHRTLEPKEPRHVPEG